MVGFISLFHFDNIIASLFYSYIYYSAIINIKLKNGSIYDKIIIKY